MAIEIKPTPMLTGEHAKNFIENVEKEQSNKASAKQIEKAKHIYDKILKNNPNIH